MEPSTPLFTVPPIAAKSAETPAAFEKRMHDILYEHTYPTTHKTLESQRRYLRGYSFGALVLSFFYYFAMKDRLFAWLSVLASVVIIFTPLLFVLPIWARRRAYTSRAWQNFGQFEAAERQWTRAAWYALVVVMLFIYLLVRLVTPTIINSFTDIQKFGSNASTGNFSEQVQQAQSSLQQDLGQ